MTKMTQIALRLESELLARVDRFAEASSRVPGLRPSRADVMREAMLRGLDVLESELNERKL